MELTERQEQGARLDKLIDSLGLTQLALAELVGFSQGYISQQVNGKREIAKGVIKFITKNYKNVNIRWLLSGEGEKFLQEVEKKEVMEVSEPGAKYEVKGSDPLGTLRALLEEHGRRLAELEAEVRRLDKEVRRVRGEGDL